MKNRSHNSRLTASVFAILGLLCLFPPGTVWAISVGQIDTFTDGSLQDWIMGISTVTTSHMTNIADGGPAGAGDNFLQVVSDGPPPPRTSGQGSRMTFFNQLQWTGDYTAAGVTAIAVDLKNLSVSETLHLRLAIDGGSYTTSLDFIGGKFATAASISLAPGSDWTRVVFSLLPGDLTPVCSPGPICSLGNDVQATLADVTELRLLNSEIPDWNGLQVVGTLGFDNIQALTVPLPPSLALFGSGLVVLVTRRRKQTFAGGRYLG